MATAVLDVWTEDKCLELIREYRARPILWDQKDPFFFKKSLKPIAWQEISAALNISADQCKHKMIILMSSFRREKGKMLRKLKNLKGDGDSTKVYKATWFAFKDMAFLLDKDSERKRQLNDSDDQIDEDDESEHSIKLYLSNHYIDSQEPPAKQAKSSVSVKEEAIQRVARPEQEENVAQTPRLQQMPGPSQAEVERDEEIKSFTSFIGNKMKKYTDTTKNAVQQAICEIIFKADQNYYENNCYDKYTIIDDEADPLNKEIFEDDKTIIKIQNDSDSD